MTDFDEATDDLITETLHERAVERGEDDGPVRRCYSRDCQRMHHAATDHDPTLCLDETISEVRDA